MDHSMTTSSTVDEDAFCQGTGTVMLSGFQAALESSTNCVKFLFEDAVVDTEAKYALAVIGAFLMGFMNEILRYGRDVHSKSFGKDCAADFVRTCGFAVQMTLAYFLMLLVMLYEFVFLIAIIVGLTAGYLVALRLTALRRGGENQVDGKTPPEAHGVASSGTQCRNDGIAA